MAYLSLLRVISNISSVSVRSGKGVSMEISFNFKIVNTDEGRKLLPLLMVENKSLIVSFVCNERAFKATMAVF